DPPRRRRARRHGAGREGDAPEERPDRALPRLDDRPGAGRARDAPVRPAVGEAGLLPAVRQLDLDGPPLPQPADGGARPPPPPPLHRRQHPEGAGAALAARRRRGRAAQARQPPRPRRHPRLDRRAAPLPGEAPLALTVPPTHRTPNLATNYSDYLKLKRLLALQDGVDGDERRLTSDELLFIVVHQADELWFKLILREIEQARDLFARDPVPETSLAAAARGLR